jgi:two-component system sensor kinase FixL
MSESVRAEREPADSSSVDYRAIFGAAPTPFLLLDANLNIVTANEAYCRATMTEPGKIAGRSVFEVFPDNPDDPAADGVRNLRASLDRVMARCQPDAMAVQKYDIRTPAGNFEERYWSAVNIPVFTPDGSPAWIIHRAEDVTEIVRLQGENAQRDQIARDQLRVIDDLRRALEENSTLKDNKLYLASIVESSNDPIIAMGLDGIITAWNNAAARLFGYSEEEIIGKPVALLFPADRASGEKELLVRIARGETIARYQTQRLTKNGRLLDILLTISPVRDNAGTIIGASKIIEDITERLAAEREMRRLQADRSHLADLVKSSNDAIVARTLEGRIASWNRAAERLFGYTAEEAVGHSTDLIVPTDRRKEADTLFQRLKGGEDVIHHETTRLRKDGTQLLVALTLSPIFDETGKIKGTSAIFRDITEQRRAEEKLKTLQAELIHLSRWNTMGMMASTIAHELNQPLTAAVNYVRAAQRILDTASPDRARANEFLGKAVDESKLAGGIIRSLREFIDKRETIRAPENLNKVVEEAISLSGSGGTEGKVEITVEMEPRLPPVLVDKIQIQQVVLNLIRNSIDAMGEETRKILAISTSVEGGLVQVSVRDEGPGIAPEIAGKLFQPFVTTKKKGMGIGLTICQSIIEAHGGRIWAEAAQPRGAAFHFRLPGIELPVA